jgi:hypothetical protein
VPSTLAVDCNDGIGIWREPPGRSTIATVRDRAWDVTDWTRRAEVADSARKVHSHARREMCVQIVLFGVSRSRHGMLWYGLVIPSWPMRPDGQ